MSTMQQINDAIAKVAANFEEFKKTNDERIAALAKGDTGRAAELDQKLTRINEDVNKFSAVKTTLEKEMELQRERIEELEARASGSKKGGNSPVDKLKSEYSETFESWVRAKGMDANLEGKLQNLARKARDEFKDITIGSSAGGGYAVPEEISREIERLEKKFSPVRDLISVKQVGTSDYKELISLGGASSGWVGESGSRTATDTPLLREITPTHGELYAYPQISEWALDDVFFSVENWLAEEVAEEFALQEGDAVIRGNGSNKPTGMLNTTPVLTADGVSPLRAAAAYQYIVSDADADGSPAGIGVRGDSLIDLIYTLNSRYRAGASWIMNSLTTGAIRKLKNGDGDYIWQPGLQAGQPAQLLGYPVSTWEQLDDIGADAFPIGFGNWKRAYVLVERTGLRITRDNVTNPGYIRFYIRRREGGIVRNNDAAKWLRTVQ